MKKKLCVALMCLSMISLCMMGCGGEKDDADDDKKDRVDKAGQLLDRDGEDDEDEDEDKEPAKSEEDEDDKEPAKSEEDEDDKEPAKSEDDEEDKEPVKADDDEDEDRKKAEALMNGLSAEELYDLGTDYRYGENGVEQDYDKAFEYYQKAMEHCVFEGKKGKLAMFALKYKQIWLIKLFNLLKNR